ncbi:TetR/AcrR family transcriptional regulator [Rhodococcus wratislaviensis]|uniref:TetR/AcrR family transcriptional regulator n=1 Tax=Rhodococcus wratislaviensis TaxID=44752 RepID=UPI003511D3D4
MPKYVDHDRRRDEITDATLAIIARDGIRAIKTRTVAEESGWSTGSLAHYFGSSRELLLGSMRRATEVQGRILRTYRDKSGLTPLEALYGIVESLLPFDDRRLALNRIFLAFCGEATADDKLNEEISEYFDNIRRFVRRAIVAAQDQGYVRGDIDADNATLHLCALIDGFTLHALFDPQIMKDLQARAGLAQEMVTTALLPPTAAPTDMHAKP